MKMDTRVKHREALRLLRAGVSIENAAKQLRMSPQTISKAWDYANGGPREVKPYRCLKCRVRTGKVPPLVKLTPCQICVAEEYKRTHGVPA